MCVCVCECCEVMFQPDGIPSAGGDDDVMSDRRCDSGSFILCRLTIFGSENTLAYISYNVFLVAPENHAHSNTIIWKICDEVCIYLNQLTKTYSMSQHTATEQILW